MGLALSEDTLECRPFLVRCCVLAASVTGCSAEDEEFCEHVSKFPGLEEKGLLSMALGLEEEVIIAGLLPFFHICWALVAASVGVLGTSLRLDSERWLRLGRGGEGEWGEGEGGVCECE